MNYVTAHVKDTISGVWYKFNDEVVQKLEGTKFMLGIEEDLEGKIILSWIILSYTVLTYDILILDQKKSRVAAKVGKGSHGSSNAYMLVYSRRDATKPESLSIKKPTTVLSDPASALPPWIQTTLISENENFETWNRDTMHRKVRRLS